MDSRVGDGEKFYDTPTVRVDVFRTMLGVKQTCARPWSIRHLSKTNTTSCDKTRRRNWSIIIAHLTVRKERSWGWIYQ